jgi:hypothetical protein
MKECFKCKKVLPLTNFYKHPQMGDGHLNKCKDCTKNDVKGNYFEKIKSIDFVIKERKRGREKYRKLYSGHGKANPDANKRWEEKYPEKKLAANMSGKLKRPFESAEKHHWSYNEEHYKDVIWMTKKEHNKAHRFIIYDQERMMYRRYDNNILLDTKAAHISFIEYCINTFDD